MPKSINDTPVQRPSLHGWDDEKVYYWSDDRGEFCVSDHPDLLRRLELICQEYLASAAASDAKPD